MFIVHDGEDKLPGHTGFFWGVFQEKKYKSSPKLQLNEQQHSLAVFPGHSMHQGHAASMAGVPGTGSACAPNQHIVDEPLSALCLS